MKSAERAAAANLSLSCSPLAGHGSRKRKGRVLVNIFMAVVLMTSARPTSGPCSTLNNPRDLPDLRGLTPVVPPCRLRRRLFIGEIIYRREFDASSVHL